MHTNSPQFVGLAELRSARDLFYKLQHDLARMVEDEANVYPVFDFFVTAEHILDWLYPDPGGAGKRKEMRQQNVLLQLAALTKAGYASYKEQGFVQ